MAITTMDQLLAAMPGQHRHFQKASVTSEGAGTFHSLWLASGLPGAGTCPVSCHQAGGSSAYIAGASTLGALNYVNASAPQGNYLAKTQVSMATVGTLILYDRLWTCASLLTAASPVTITTSGCVSRGGTDDIELWLEVYTAPGATAGTWTVAYTDAINGSGRSASYTHPANAETVGQMMPMNLQAGDTSVISCSSFSVSASTATGNIGITLLRRLAEIPVVSAGTGIVLDSFGLGLPSIPNDACLGFMVFCSTTNTGQILGSVDIVAG